MKFTGALSTLLVVLPFLVLQVSAAPSVSLEARAGRGGGKGGGQGGNNNNNAGAGASSAAAATATAGAANGTAAAAAAANGTAANGGGGGAAAAAAAANGTAAAGGAANAAAAAGGNPQTSLTLDPSVIGPNLAQDGLAGAGSVAGQAASATSTNNFINSCVGKTITNGLQAQGGSCNPVPMGDIPSKANQPTCKFQFPTNLANVAANTAFTVKMAIQGLQTGAFVNPNTNYFAAPQALNAQGQIIGHSHIVIQNIPSLTSTTPLDPTVFSFFVGLNAAAQGNVLSASVAKGLPAGTYRVFSINTAANHQPVLGPVAQHGSFDDAVYFTVGTAAAQAAATAAGGAGAGAAAAGGAAASNATNNAAAGAAASVSSAAAGTAASVSSAAAGTAASVSSAAASTATAAAAGAAPAAANATAPAAAGGAAAGKGGQGGAGKGGKGGARGGRRSFMIARQN